MAPNDADMSSVARDSQLEVNHLLNGPHGGVSVCAFCDARVTHLPFESDGPSLRDLLTINSSESSRFE